MSLALSVKNPPPLAGVDEVSIPKNALIKFSYPAIDDPLFIHSGATSIKWSYVLNTQTFPTIGGEVDQILSCFVGPITITGQAAGLKTNQSGQLGKNEIPGWKNDPNGKTAYGPNHELQDIVNWFVKYMTIAGTDNTGNAFRNERAIYFEYPERGWNFQIMPTQLSGFRYDKTVIAPEWSITAEIVSNNALDYFSGVTMSSFTDDLLTSNTKLQGQIGLSNFATTTTETANPSFGQTGDFGSTDPFLNPSFSPSLLATLGLEGDNFQGLVAAWSSGDFAHFGFGALLDNNNLPSSVEDALQKTILGSLPGWSTGSSGGQSGTGSFVYNGSNKQDAVAVQIANAFSNKNMPPELGIAVALHESTLNPDAYQGDFANQVEGDGAVGLFQTFYHSLANGGAGRGASLPHADEIRQAQAPLTLGQAPPSGYSVTKFYPVTDQVQDAATWFKPYDSSGTSNDALARWAFRAQQGTGYTSDNTTTGSCTAAFAANIAKAKSILGQLTSSGTSATGVRASVLAWVAKADSYGNITWSESCNRKVTDYAQGHWPPTADCSVYTALMYYWGTNGNAKFATNGTTFNDSNTTTIAHSFKKIAFTNARAGDVIEWSSPDHVAIMLENWGGGSTKISSLGSGVGPKVETFDGESAFHAAGSGQAYAILP